MALRTAAGEVDGIEGPGKHGHAAEETEDISCQHETPAPQSRPTHLAALKGRIRQHYELTSDYYYSLWYIHIVSKRTSACHPTISAAYSQAGANTSTMAIFFHRTTRRKPRRSA